MKDFELKNITINEFTRHAETYNNDKVFSRLINEDYPLIFDELAKEPFNDLLDCGCGNGAFLSILSSKILNENYGGGGGDNKRSLIGIDITPKMIEQAEKLGLEGVKFLVGDCENLPFDDNSFDVIICSHSFHHYPNPDKFFTSVNKVLRPNGKLILQDNVAKNFFQRWMKNHIWYPFERLKFKRHKTGDVRCYSMAEIDKLCKNSGLALKSFTDFNNGHMQCVIRKIK